MFQISGHCFYSPMCGKIYLNGERETIAFLRQQLFSGVAVSGGLTWTPDVKTFKRKLQSVMNVVGLISWTTCETTALSLLRFFQAIFVGFLRYSLAIFNATCKTNISELHDIQEGYLRARLGLPRSATTAGSTAHSHQLPTSALEMQENFVSLQASYWRSKSQYSNVATDQSASDSAKALSRYWQAHPSHLVVHRLLLTPWSMLRRPDI